MLSCPACGKFSIEAKMQAKFIDNPDETEDVLLLCRHCGRYYCKDWYISLDDEPGDDQDDEVMDDLPDVLRKDYEQWR